MRCLRLPTFPADLGWMGSVPTLELEEIPWNFLDSFRFHQSLGFDCDDNNDCLFAGGHTCMADSQCFAIVKTRVNATRFHR